MSEPLVSVVIPTRDRPQLVSRAVESVFKQTLESVEILVIVDGPDENTVKELEKLNIANLKIIPLPKNVGPASARNIGVEKAQGTWIAFLDDDDEWLPQKLELRLEAANKSQLKFPVMSSRFIALTAKGEFTWPRRLLTADEPLSDYLFARSSIFGGEGFIQTSTLFTKKELLLQVPFIENKYKHEDWVWLLQVNSLEDVEIQFVPEATAYWHSDIGRKRLSNISDWHYSLEWIRSVKHLVTRKAYSSFIMIIVSHEASKVGDWKAFWILLQEATKLGSPRVIDYLLYMGIWLVPQDLRQQFRALNNRYKQMFKKPQSGNA